KRHQFRPPQIKPCHFERRQNPVASHLLFVGSGQRQSCPQQRILNARSVLLDLFKQPACVVRRFPRASFSSRSQIEVFQEEAVRGDVQYRGALGLQERLFARPAFGQQGRSGQQRANAFALLRRVRQGGEVVFAEGGRGRLFPDWLLRRPFRLFQQTRRFYLTPASEVRVGDHQRPTLTLSGHLQSQQVTPARQIAD